MLSRLSTNEPTEEKEARLICSNSEGNPNIVKSIKWFKDENMEIVNSNDVSVTVFENELIFSYLNHSLHNGLYKCQIELINGQILTSNATRMLVFCMNSSILTSFDFCIFVNSIFSYSWTKIKFFDE